jgi:SAM-dependent methyltransferase
MTAEQPPAPPAQRWFADRYAENARFVADLAEPLIGMLDAQAGEVILDLGCGDGALTEKIAASGARVIGVDASPDQVAATRGRGIEACVVDGQALAFDGVFDAVITNAALHWMQRPDAVIEGMHRALKPGGRLVGEMGGEGNVSQISGAIIAAMEQRGLDGQARFPWYFPSVDDYGARLKRGGFTVDYIELISRPTHLPGDMAAWLDTFGENFLLAVLEKDRRDFVADVVAELRPFLFEPYGEWVADYVRLRFTARHVEGESK